MSFFNDQHSPGNVRKTKNENSWFKLFFQIHLRPGAKMIVPFKTIFLSKLFFLSNYFFFQRFMAFLEDYHASIPTWNGVKRKESPCFLAFYGVLGPPAALPEPTISFFQNYFLSKLSFSLNYSFLSIAGPSRNSFESIRKTIFFFQVCCFNFPRGQKRNLNSQTPCIFCM